MTSSVYEAAHAGAVWREMSHFGRFRFAGKDAGALLHHLSTNNVKALKVGASCDSVLLSSRARVLDWLTVAREESGFLIIASPNRREMLLPHARKFVLFRQDVTMGAEDVALFGVFGARRPDLVAAAREQGVSAAPTSRLPFGGVWLWGEGARAFVQSLKLCECDAETFNVLRVESGVPATGAELSEDVNPWEARLDGSISLAKGCYNGQEVVARLNTYQKVKQRLHRLQLSAPVSLPFGERLGLQRDGREAGFVTSAVETPHGTLALGFVRGNAEPGEELGCWRDGTLVALARVLEETNVSSGATAS